MSIPKTTIETILNTARLDEVIGHFQPLKKTGSSFSCTCPFCHTEATKGKGLKITPNRGIYKCFSCGAGGTSPINYLMEAEGKSYPDALKWLGDFYNIEVKDEREVKGPQRRDKKNTPTFRDKQLESSGLTDEDQKALVWVDDDTQQVVDVFEAATRTDDGQIVEGDDMLIWYFDLNGKHIEFTPPKSTKKRKLWRFRWQIPDLHRDREGRPMKYTSPAGSGSHLFIPEVVRRAYADGRVIKRLFIQEGEKKAVKACKHGIFSVGVMGIQNIGQHNKLPYELQLIVQRCHIEEVVFVLDSDFDHLSSELKPGSKVDKRPLSFYYAVRSFKDYFKTFTNVGIYLEIYFAHIKDNPANDKGLDDLLANTLKGRENTLLEDFSHAMNEKDGQGEFVNAYKISTVTDIKLLEFWNLHSAESFAEKYREQLEHLPEFQIGKHKWKFDENNKLVPSQPLLEDEQFYEKYVHTTKTGMELVQYRFSHYHCRNFLSRRGFGRFQLANRTTCFVSINNRVVEQIESTHMRDYVTEFTLQTVDKAERKDVMDMLYRGGKMYLGPDSLSNLPFVAPHFEIADKTYQFIYFREKVWKITAQGIEERLYTELEHFVWRDKVIDMDIVAIEATYPKDLGVKSKDFINVEQVTEDMAAKVKQVDLTPFVGSYLIHFSEQAEQCHFAKFLWNSSEFFWRKMIDPASRTPFHKDNRTMDEIFENGRHFVAKMTAIGYLLHKYRDKSCEKAVIAMDGKLSEVGESFGRTGKSIVGTAIGKVIPQAYIGAKSKDLTSDPFIWEEVNEKIENVFIDDARANVDFEFFFPVITGQMTVNVKGMKKSTLPEPQTPKLFFTTNHAINGNSPSFKDRQFLIAFSDWYNETHKPIDDFGVNFFTEWDEKQWTLFYNFMASCLQLYFKAQSLGWGVNRSGLIAAPTERLELRRMLQFIGMNFLLWADEYFGVSDNINPADITSDHLGMKIPRIELYNDYLDKNPLDRKYITAHIFKKKIKAWCEYRGLIFNPHKRDEYGRPGLDDKSGGVEFFTISNSNAITSQGEF